MKKKKENREMTENVSQPQQPPKPDPALKLLDRFVGTWIMKGRTVGSEVDNVTGRTTFEWLPGGFFLQQRIELDFAGYEIRGLEVIGYDPAAAVRELQLHGCGALFRWLLENDFVDEMTLFTFPAVVGQGTRLFPDTGRDRALELVESRATPNGVMIQVYRPS